MNIVSQKFPKIIPKSLMILFFDNFGTFWTNNDNCSIQWVYLGLSLLAGLRLEEVKIRLIR